MVEAGSAIAIAESPHRLASSEAMTLLTDEAPVEPPTDCFDGTEQQQNLKDLQWPFFT